MNLTKFVLLGSAAVISINAYAADKVKAQLEGNYASITKSFIKKDINSIGAFLAPNFAVHDGAKTGTRAQILKDYKSQMEQIKDISWVRKVESISRDGKAYVATVDGDIKGTISGPDSKPHKLHLVAVAKDTWTLTGSKWLLMSTVVVSKTVTIDGKPVPMR